MYDFGHLKNVTESTERILQRLVLEVPIATKLRSNFNNDYVMHLMNSDSKSNLFLLVMSYFSLT